MAKYRITSIPQSLPKAQKGLFKKRRKEKDPIIGRSISNTYAQGDMPVAPQSNVYFPQYTIENPAAPIDENASNAPLRYDALRNYFTDYPLIEPTYVPETKNYITNQIAGFKQVPINIPRFDEFDIKTGKTIPGNIFAEGQPGPFEAPFSRFIPQYKQVEKKLHYYDPKDSSVEAIASRMNQPTSDQEYTSYPDPIALKSMSEIDRENTWNNFVAKKQQEQIQKQGEEITKLLINLQKDRIKQYVTNAHGPIKNGFNPKHIEIKPFMLLSKEQYDEMSKEELDVYTKEFGLIPYYDKKDNSYKFYETKLIAAKIWNQGLRQDELVNKSKIADKNWINENFGDLIKEADNQYRESFYNKWLEQRVDKDLDPKAAAESFGIKWGVPEGIKKFSGESEKKLVKYTDQVYNKIANDVYAGLGLQGMDKSFFTLNGTTLVKGDPLDLIPHGIRNPKDFFMNAYVFKAEFGDNGLPDFKTTMVRNGREKAAEEAKQKILATGKKIPTYKMVPRGDGRFRQVQTGVTYDPWTLQKANDAYDQIYYKEYYDVINASAQYRQNQDLLKTVQDKLAVYKDPTKIDELIEKTKNKNNNEPWLYNIISKDEIEKIASNVNTKLIADVNAKAGIYPEGTATIGPAPAYTPKREELTWYDKLGDYLKHPIDAITYGLDPTVSMHPDGRKFTYDELMDIGEATGDYSWQGDPGGALGSFTRGVGNFFIQPFNPVKAGTDWAKAYKNEGLFGLGESMIGSALSAAGAKGGIKALQLLDKSADAIKAYRVAAGLKPQWINSTASYLRPMLMESMKPLTPYIAAETPFSAIRTAENLGLQFDPNAEGLSKFIDESKINPLAAAWYGLNTYWGGNILKNVYKTPGYNLSFGENLPFTAKLQTPKGGAFTFGPQTTITEIPGLSSAVSKDVAEEYFRKGPLLKEYRQFANKFHPDRAIAAGLSEAEIKAAAEQFAKAQNISEGKYFKTLPFYNTGDGYRLAAESPQYTKPFGSFGTLTLGRPTFRPATLEEIATGKFQNLTPPEVKPSGFSLEESANESEILKPKFKPSGKRINKYGGDMSEATPDCLCPPLCDCSLYKKIGSSLVKNAGNVVRSVAPSLAKYFAPAEVSSPNVAQIGAPSTLAKPIMPFQIPSVTSTIPSQVQSAGNYSVENLSPETTSNPDIVNKYMQMTIDFPEEEITPERVALLERALSFTPIETLPNKSSQGEQLEFNFSESPTVPVIESGFTPTAQSAKSRYMNNLDWLKTTGKKLYGGRYNMAGEDANLSGLSINELLNMPHVQDKNALFDMSSEEFQNTVLSPSGKIMPYMTPDLRVYDPSTIYIGSEEKNAFATEFNKHIAILNEIAKRRNKAGNPVYEFVGLDPETNTLKIRTLPQTITYDNGQTVHYPGGETTWGVGIHPGQYEGLVEEIASKDYIENLPGLAMRSTAEGVYSPNVVRMYPFQNASDDKPVITGTGAYDALNEYLKQIRLGNVKSGQTNQTPSGRISWDKAIRLGKAFGFKIGENTYGVRYKNGGISLKLSKSEIDKYVKGGYIVEEE